MLILLLIILFVFLVLKPKNEPPLLFTMKEQDNVQINKDQENQPTEKDENFLDIDMNGATIKMKVGEKRRLFLPGNATTGYAWRIVSIDGSSIETDGKWHYKPQFPFLIGGQGYFQKEFYAKQPGLTDIYFIYDPVAEPQLGYYYYLQFDVRS